MTPTRACATIAVLFASLIGSTAGARECAAVVEESWVRMPPMAMPMLAGFARIRNPCADPVVVVGVSSPAFEDVSLHETRVVDGVSRMRPVARLRIAAGDAMLLQPGGLHLMLMQPRGELAEGSRIPIAFALEGGGELRGDFQVRKPGG